MNRLTHPSQHLLEFLKRQPEVQLQFSIYEYNPQSVFDKRHIIELPSSQLCFDWVTSTIANLGPGEELAFHSKYKKGKRYFHVPMIDFNCPNYEFDYAYSSLEKTLSNDMLSGLEFYDSGRSLHAYGRQAIDNSDWVKFMGRLLLANLPHKPAVVDTRWIGHRLLGGYASLRWSSNSSHYIKTPERRRRFSTQNV